MKIKMKNTKTGEIREIKVGWSWVLFLFSGFLGIPLFLRGLNALGAVFLALWVVNILIVEEILFVILAIVSFGLSIWVGIKGNEMTAKNYLERGWQFSEPDSDAIRFAKGKWGVYD